MFLRDIIRGKLFLNDTFTVSDLLKMALESLKEILSVTATISTIIQFMTGLYATF